MPRAGALLLGLTLVAQPPCAARAAGPRPPLVRPGVPTDPFAPVLVSCWLEARLFESLRTGPVDFCRGHLRYRPGALDCARFVDQVCWVYLPAQAEYTLTRTPNLRAAVVCPPGPEPPVCPRLGP